MENEKLAFTETEVEALTGIKRSTLQGWLLRAELLVINTLLAVVLAHGNREVLRTDYNEVKLPCQIAERHHTAVLVIPHLRKMPAGVNRKSTLSIPEPIAQLQRQLDQFRSTQSRRTKLPESPWQRAVELARQHGVYAVAHPLLLDYMGQKKRLGGVPHLRRKAAKPAFVELIAPHPATLEDCIIEFESASGGKMRIHWKAAVPPDWAALLRARRDTQG